MKKNIIKIIILILAITSIFVYTKNKEEISVQTKTPIIISVNDTKVFSQEKKIVPESILYKRVVVSTSTSGEKIVDKNLPSIVLVVDGATSTISFLENSTLYDLLLLAKNNGQINFSGKEYPALGFFVTDIGGLRNGGGKNLIYYINGKEAQVGVSSYAPKQGDIISWKLE